MTIAEKFCRECLLVEGGCAKLPEGIELFPTTTGSLGWAKYIKDPKEIRFPDGKVFVAWNEEEKVWGSYGYTTDFEFTLEDQIRKVFGGLL